MDNNATSRKSKEPPFWPPYVVIYLPTSEDFTDYFCERDNPRSKVKGVSWVSCPFSNGDMTVRTEKVSDILPATMRAVEVCSRVHKISMYNANFLDKRWSSW